MDGQLMSLNPIFLLIKGGEFSDVPPPQPRQAQVCKGHWLTGKSYGRLRMVPAEENTASVLEWLQHSRRCGPHEVTAIEWGLPRSLEPSLYFNQMSTHLVPPEPAHDGVDGP